MKDRLDNLKNARCYEDKDGVGGKVSKWFNLSKFDVEWAIFEIERLRSPPDVFYEYDEKKSAFLRDRIEQLETALKEAQEDLKLLDALRAAGVDNWSGYDYALEIYALRILEEEDDQRRDDGISAQDESIS